MFLGCGIVVGLATYCCRVAELYYLLFTPYEIIDLLEVSYAPVDGLINWLLPRECPGG